MVKNIMDETKKGFMQNIGDLSFKKISETNFEFSIKILENFLNTGGIAHGGFIATIADTGMGNAAHISAGNRRCVTINLDIKFIAAGKINETLILRQNNNLINSNSAKNAICAIAALGIAAICSTIAVLIYTENT